MAARMMTILLLLLLGMIHAQLWIGRGSLPKVVGMRQELSSVEQANQEQQWRNEQLASEVRDLKEGLEMIEEKARTELGMIKPNELLVQIAQSKKSPK
jgi:cell division protein FtsB